MQMDPHFSLLTLSLKEFGEESYSKPCCNPIKKNQMPGAFSDKFSLVISCFVNGLHSLHQLKPNSIMKQNKMTFLNLCTSTYKIHHSRVLYSFQFAKSLQDIPTLTNCSGKYQRALITNLFPWVYFCFCVYSGLSTYLFSK